MIKSLKDALAGYLNKRSIPKAASISLPQLDSPDLTKSIPSAWADHDCYIIEYKDSAGANSVRRVAIRNQEGQYLHCFCFERDDYRTFRRDRIQAVFDLDGELLEPPPFAIGQKVYEETVTDVMEPTHVQMRRSIQAEVALLRIIALSDGRAKRQENDQIFNFVYQKLLAEGLPDNPENSRAISKWVRSFYPYEQMLDQTIFEITNRRTVEQIVELLQMCRTVIKADGAIATEERQRFEELGILIKEALRARFDRSSG
jgi:hypothetical protein